MPTTPIGAVATPGSCTDDTHNKEYNLRIDAIDDRVAVIESVTPTGGFADLTGLGVQATFNVPTDTRRVRILWNPNITILNWPGVLTTDGIGYQFHGLYNEFPTAPAIRRTSARVVSAGVVEFTTSGAQDAVAPTPVDLWIEK